MKRIVIAFVIVFTVILSLCACGNSRNYAVDPIEQTEIDPVEQARNEVVSKWENESDVLGTAKFIEDTYKQYPDDDVISNVYFYCIAKQQYDYYVSFERATYLETAKEYAAKIDPNYSGEFASEMHQFVNSLISSDDLESEHNRASAQEDNYNSLTNKDKKAICEYIQSRYDYYDNLNGGYTGDKYSDIIMEEAAKKYELSVSQIKIIWMNMYSY